MCVYTSNVSGLVYNSSIKKEKEIQMSVEITDLEVEISTYLALYSNLDGKAFWDEVSRLAKFGDDWSNH